MPKKKTVLFFALFLSLGLATPGRAADPIFDQTRLHETSLTMDPSDWQALRENFRTNQYYAATLTLDGEVVQQVGIRSRGFGSRSGEKPGLKVDFNRYVSTQEFHGMKTLVIDNLVQDVSMLREPLSYAVFEAMGIPAPQISFTRLTVNDQYWGCYTLVQDIKKPFLEQRLGDKEGYLYDYQHEGEYFFQVRGTTGEAYVPVPFQPETHEDNPDPSGLIALVAAINDTPDATFLQTMANFWDVDRLLTYMATENAIAENDGLLGYAGMNNFFLYQYSGGTRFTLIPWDKDTTFQSASWPILQRLETNVLSARLMQFPSAQKTYLDAARRAAGFVSAAYLVPRLDALYGVMRTAALSDTNKPYTNDEFELGVGGLRGIVIDRQADILVQAGGATARGSTRP